MSQKTTKSRRYNSTRRQDQARQTRRTITEAARRLFIERGYAGATLGAIAEEAGVAAETIYATFGSKRAILSHVADVSLVGDDEPASLLARPAVRSTEQEPDQRQQIRMFAEQMTTIMTRMAPIFDVIRTAAKTEPEIAEVRGHLLRDRQQGMLYFVNALRAHGPLREGLTPEDAADQVFALSSGEMFTVLTADLGWSGDRYTAWLAKTLITILLP